jgi:uncharacterized membrane protein
MMHDNRSHAQRWADWVTQFSGSWTFIWWFAAICIVWVVANQLGLVTFDVYPFLFLNWTLTIVSTFQNPLILMSQNRQNENDHSKTAEILQRLAALQATLDELKKEHAS